MQCARAVFAICGLSGSAIFSTLSHKRHDFRKQVIENKMYFAMISTSLSETFLILGRIERDVKKHLLVFILFLSDFKVTRIFSTDFEEFSGKKFLKKSVQWESSCSSRTDGQT